VTNPGESGRIAKLNDILLLRVSFLPFVSPSPPLSVPRFKRAPNSRRWILSSAWHRHANTKQFNNATEISRAPLQDKYPVAAQHPTTVFTQEVPSFFVFPIRRVQFISAVVKPWGCNSLFASQDSISTTANLRKMRF